jgi:hypothetical protein
MALTKFYTPKRGEVPTLSKTDICVFGFDVGGISKPFFTEVFKLAKAGEDPAEGEFRYLQHQKGADVSEPGKWTRAVLEGTKKPSTDTLLLTNILLVARTLKPKKNTYSISKITYRAATESLKQVKTSPKKKRKDMSVGSTESTKPKKSKKSKKSNRSDKTAAIGAPAELVGMSSKEVPRCGDTPVVKSSGGLFAAMPGKACARSAGGVDVQDFLHSVPFRSISTTKEEEEYESKHEQQGKEESGNGSTGLQRRGEDGRQRERQGEREREHEHKSEDDAQLFLAQHVKPNSALGKGTRAGIRACVLQLHAAIIAIATEAWKHPQKGPVVS